MEFTAASIKFEKTSWELSCEWVSKGKSNMHLDYTFKFQYNDMKKQAEGIKSRRANGIHTWYESMYRLENVYFIDLF